jgi:hypothetical protein
VAFDIVLEKLVMEVFIFMENIEREVTFEGLAHGRFQHNSLFCPSKNS